MLYNEHTVKLLQESLSQIHGMDIGPAGADGRWGDKTEGAFKEYIELSAAPPPTPPASHPWPEDTVEALRQFYGLEGVKGGREPDLVWFTFPYPMRLYDSNRYLKRHRCHRKVKESLEGVLETARDRLGLDFLKGYDLDSYYGCYNPRKMRGGSSISRHSWGIAIDIGAHRYPFKLKWKEEKIGQPGWSDMPVAWLEIWEEFGWKTGARAWGYDSMHTQATQ